jgi:type II secretory pathway pseudopilin PulG
VSPSPERDPRVAHRPPVDQGFSLIEVIVALGLTMVVLVALLPQLLVGIKGAALANDVTEGKGVVQGQLETMRNLPYHVAPSAERRIDLLDTYFPDLVPVTPAFSCKTGAKFTAPAAGPRSSTSWSGYVTGSATRCEYEPATGSFYRMVEARGGYVLVTDTQFLDSLSRVTAASPLYMPVVAETAGPYNSQGANGTDTPVSAQVGVTVTAFFVNRGTLHPVSAYTQIAEVLRTPTRVQGVANARALEIVGITPAGEALSVSAGDMNITGSLSRSSSATVTTHAVSARLSTDDTVGPRLSAIAPPTSTTAARTVPAGTLTGGDCGVSYVCWGSGVLDPVTVNADGGLPTAGSATNPVEARVTADPGVSFRSTVDPALGLVRPELDLKASEPLAGMVSGSAPVGTSACGPSKGGLVTGRGYMQSTAALVDTCAEAGASTLSLFPTNFAPAGVLRLTLTSAAARCTVNRSGGVVATSSYQVTVQYADPSAPSGYTTTVISRTSGSTPVADPLPGLLVRPVGGGHLLGDYVDSWTLSSPSRSTPATTASASVPGALKLVSRPLRNRPDTAADPDPASVISLTLGSVSCTAEDAR